MIGVGGAVNKVEGGRLRHEGLAEPVVRASVGVTRGDHRLHDEIVHVDVAAVVVDRAEERVGLQAGSGAPRMSSKFSSRLSRPSPLRWMTWVPCGSAKCEKGKKKSSLSCSGRILPV
jgi:hypothetical protein